MLETVKLLNDGENQLGSLIYRGRVMVEVPGKDRYVDAELDFEQDPENALTIGRILIDNENYAQNNGPPKVEVIRGGLNHTHVTIQFQSDEGFGLMYNVYIYGE
ncbi:uncharacterized protein LOC111074518 [Drosophila obscura]|uniref:uncharacterized protein LOC111074518 n=1 Tax=Drosophila obscura TaxID=7282 RepID=UPI001BB10C50|nr:uncharacterized protein LOC111074518 [Drosophila obscura]